MTVSLADPWTHIVAIMLLPTYVLLRLSKSKIKQCRHAIISRNPIGVLCFWLWQLRWHVLCGVLVFGVSLLLVVGTARLFAGIETSESGLTLDYPWPRSNVYLNWKEVTESKVETHHFRRGYKFRLRVEAPSAVYVSPWTDKKEVQSAHDLIQAHLRKPETNLP